MSEIDGFKRNKELAEHGDSDAQNDLGYSYETGQGVEQDYTEAAKWYRKSAEQGNARAQSNLEKLETRNKYYYLFFDTETTGLPINYNAPSSDVDNWPRLIQLSWIVTDINGIKIKEQDFIIKPNGFSIPQSSTYIHGITQLKATQEGKEIGSVLEIFLKDFERASCIVGHNIQFDKKIVGAELIRLGYRDLMDTKKNICTMLSSAKFCAVDGAYGYKYPKLQELYKKLFGCNFDNAHNSLSDVRATEKCFRELVRIGIIKI